MNPLLGKTVGPTPIIVGHGRIHVNWTHGRLVGIPAAPDMPQAAGRTGSDLDRAGRYREPGEEKP
ncbi:MAG: hypothetical protein IRY83_02235 [Chloroflexi bacterium]|nr:hypothetical protein [Chloroflexota bacterium]HLG50491.1 hypothetical protein [Chloroflexota bacterium]